MAELAEDKSHKPIGQLMVTYEWSDWRNGLFWWIQSVYVVPDRRRMGVFRAMYDHILVKAKAEPRVCGIRLYVERENRVPKPCTNAWACYHRPTWSMNKTLFLADMDTYNNRGEV